MRLAARRVEKSRIHVTNFAATILQRIAAAGTARPDVARQCAAQFDRNGDGSVSAVEFQHVFAALQRTEALGGGATTSYLTSGFRPTIFDETLFPSYSNAYAASAYQATAMLGQLDTDGDNSVSLAEWTADGAAAPDTPADPAAPDPTAPPTPDERATQLLSAYDLTGKGYITIDDVVSKWMADPSLGNIADAGTAIEAWDTDGDGKVTHDNIVAAYQVMDAADTVIGTLGDAGSGEIALDRLDAAKTDALGLTETQLSGWDANKDGLLTRNEVIDGLKLLRLKTAGDAENAAFAALVAKYDANRSGAIDRDELASALGQVTLDANALDSTFAAWDTNGDAAIDAAELQAGYKAITDAQAVVAAYDTDKKGYFNEADLQRAIDANGSVDGQASAHEILLAWDRDGDGRVSVQDVLTMKQAMDAAAAAQAAVPADGTALV